MVLFWNQSTETLKPTSNWLTKILLKMVVKMLCGAVCCYTNGVLHMSDQMVTHAVKCLDSRHLTAPSGNHLHWALNRQEHQLDYAVTYQQHKFCSYLDANGFEELGMSQWKLDHLFDLCQLLTTSTNVVVTHLVQCILLLLTSQAHTLKPPHYWHILHITQHLTWAGATVLMLNIRETVFGGIKIL